jgi:hypothetical protein
VTRADGLPVLAGNPPEMERLDRLEWRAGVSFEAHGVRIGVRVTDPDLMTPISERLPFGSRPSASQVVEQLYSLVSAGHDPGEAGSHVLFGNATELARAGDVVELLETFEDMSQLCVAEMSPTRVFVHAGVVGWRGRAIVVPGHSYTGKTSLVIELVRAGATYYSDEFALLDTRGRVHPFARPLGVRPHGGAEQEKVTMEELGGPTGARPLPAGLVVVSPYRSGARWRPRELSRARGVLELLANTVPARRRPRTVLPVLERAVSGATVLKGGRGEARDMAPKLLAKLND